MLQRATVRPSTQFYLRFSLLMVRSPGFGSIQHDYFALFRLAFAWPPSYDLSLPCQITRWIVLQKAPRHPEVDFRPTCFASNLDQPCWSCRKLTTGLRVLVRTQFQVLFHSPPGVLLTFPSRYLFSIDHVIYLALEGGPPRFSQGFTCPDLLDN